MGIETLKTRIQPLREQLVAHPVYQRIKTQDELCSFTEEHIFAVWDFMSLLKSLQRSLTCVEVPWMPTPNRETRRFINEIVVGEESDYNAQGQTMSHFEMYLHAMNDMGASVQEIKKLSAKLSRGENLSSALSECAINEETKSFVEYTFEIIRRGKIHEIASLFTFGREDLIPAMFIEMVKTLNASTPKQMESFLFYLERHIEVDGDDHGPLSLKLMEEVCEGDPQKWEEATLIAEDGLRKRIQLWNGVVRKTRASAPLGLTQSA